MSKTNLDNITLVCVSSVKIKESILALEHCMKFFNFKEVKFITHEDISLENIIVEKCPKLDYKKYSEYIIYHLYKHLTTEFALIINWDGFILNPEQWDSNYLNYDYIGALWTHEHNFYDASNNESLVGNGGFSLRSRKLLKLANELNIPWEPREGKYWHEDAWICVKNKHLYEKNGCKWAPKDIALKFSIEQGKKKTLESFGFHGKFYYHQFKHLL
jgi:hypothetical protein|tara:strand:+ start:496 stop:1143 length:648 start_codon:yes stop_codon:yes gene_type:complete